MTTEQFDCYRYTLIGMTEIAEQYVTELGQDEDFKFYIGNTHDEIFYSLSIPSSRNFFRAFALVCRKNSAAESNDILTKSARFTLYKCSSTT